MKSSSLKGFTLVELLISISIFTLITTVSVFNYSSFNSSVALTNLAYEIALSVRQAQFYGITVKQSSSALVAEELFSSGYGVHFERNSASYVLFEDKSVVNHVYSPSTELLETYTIQKGNKIAKMCVNSLSGLDCTPTSLDLSFVRPNPDTYMAVGMNGNPAVLDLLKNKAIICLTSPKGDYRKVVVESTGQISVSTAATECI